MKTEGFQEREHTDPCAPLPTAIKGREDGWRVTPAPPLTEAADVNIAERKMRVPVGFSDLEVTIRAHQMGRVKWTPSKAHQDQSRKLFERDHRQKLTDESIAAAETFRINVLLTQAGISMEALHHPVVAQGEAVRIVLGREWLEFLRHIAKWHQTGAQDFLAIAVAACGNLTTDGLQRVTMLYERIVAYENQPPTFEEITLPLAALLDSYGKETNSPWYAPPEPGDSEGEGEGTGDPDDGEEDGPLSDAEEATPSEGKYRETDEPHLALGKGSTVGWGDMIFSAVPLDRSVAGRWARKRIAEEEGAIPRSIHRLPTDGRVFDRRIRKMGGTILIDTSGSMSLSSRDVYRIVEAAPGCTIAIYCGSGTKGWLRVIARNGRIADASDMQIDAGGNIVDGPALEWLLTEEEPRLWVCDGGVTGRQDSSCGVLTKEAERLRSLGKVLRLDNVPSAVDFIKKKKMVLRRT